VALALPLAVLTFVGAVACGTSRTETGSLTQPAVSTHASLVQQGAAAFEGGAFGGISTDALTSNAVPWRLVAAALVLDARSRDPGLPVHRETLNRVLAGFGFLTDATVINRPHGLEGPNDGMPLGFTAGDLAPVGGTKVRVANLGCAACHAGVTYDAAGLPQLAKAMLGMPNSSLDLEAYTMTVFRALRRHVDDDRLLPTSAALFPEMGWRERQSLRHLVLPLARRRLAALAGEDRPMPFPNGSPGSTNGVAALKSALGVPLAGGGMADGGIVSIPDLGHRMWKTSLLVDGSYAVPGRARLMPTTAASVGPEQLRSLAAITTFFTVPSMGVHLDKAHRSLPHAEAIAAFLTTYRPQPFPGVVDQVAAQRGAGVYAANCASCHGSYSAGTRPQLIRFPNWTGDVGTDPLRAQMFDKGLVRAVASGPYRERIAVARGQGYVAPPLTGVWASAPYLHNGSVPTLAALLTPRERPARFLVGGHALDMQRVGLRLAADGRYPAGVHPFSTPAWTDTRQPGKSSAGHRYGEQLGAADKAALLEYLKLL
jgi:cytochrome c553